MNSVWKFLLGIGCIGQLILATDYCGGGILYCDDGYYCCDGYVCCSYGLSGGGIAGLVVGTTIFIVFCVIIVVCCRRYRRPMMVQTGAVNPGVTVISSGQQMGAVQQPMPYGQYPGQPPQYPGQHVQYPGQPGAYPYPPPQYSPA